ncbi:glutathione S-transferase family protein [Altererythrobacter salegens]|uniref:Glutathione S-transferase family protein n=1 Tax=Croceibacterium salegens TaxID=1737568 RepID=A0A6I4SWM8_9SPHN|nr:glutathione S-transferase family protein [Croceibacterium salegens]
MELYGHLFSSYTWKALIPLYANGTEFEFREIGPAGSDEVNAFVHAEHPAGKFPILADGDTVVIEATAIIEYLAVHHPGPAPLIPADPAIAAEARMIDRVFDNYFQSNFQRIVGAYLSNTEVGNTPVVGEPDMAEVHAGKAGLRRAYAWLEGWLGNHTLPPHVSLVTCSAAPALFYADWCERIPEDCPRITALRAELLALPPVVRCVEDARPYRPYFPPGMPVRD